jgi:hypothetical protein
MPCSMYVPPSRVLLLRHPFLVHLLRHHCSRHTAARSSPRCRAPLPSIRTSARGASNRFRRSLFISTPILHSPGLRRTSRNGGMELWPAVPRKDGAGSTTMSRQRYQRRSSDFIYRERERERDEFQPSAYAHGSDLIDPEFQHHSMEGTCGCSEEEEPAFF